MKNSVLKTAVLGCAAGLSLLAFGGEKLIKDGDTVVFFGDSITHGGRYHEFVTDFYRTRFPEARSVNNKLG